MSESSQVRQGQIYRGVKPSRDPAYLKFIRSIPCVACLRTSVDEERRTGRLLWAIVIICGAVLGWGIAGEVIDNVSRLLR